MKKIGLIAGLLFSANLVLVIFLLLSQLATYISPEVWIVPSYVGLGFPVLWLLNTAFLLFWIFFKPKFALLPLLFMLGGLPELPLHLQLSFQDKSESKSFKVFTHNVRNFDLYNWTNNKKTRNNILGVIKDSDADIICLQEFFNTTDPNHDFKTLDTILQFNKSYDWYIEYTDTVKKTEHWGMATFSTFPVVGRGRIQFEKSSNNLCIYTDLVVKADTLRVYNVHLASIKFEEEEYRYIENVVDNEIDAELSGGKSLLSKLQLAFIRRAAQARLVKRHMNKSPYPVIVCGDFNDTPSSFAYHLLSDGLKDSFREHGNGFGTTYNGTLPLLRIDYILTSPGIEIANHEIIRADISDHFPICAVLTKN